MQADSPESLAGVAELVDALDLKSGSHKEYGFDSHPRHSVAFFVFALVNYR